MLSPPDVGYGANHTNHTDCPQCVVNPAYVYAANSAQSLTLASDNTVDRAWHADS